MIKMSVFHWSRLVDNVLDLYNVKPHIEIYTASRGFLATTQLLFQLVAHHLTQHSYHGSMQRTSLLYGFRHKQGKVFAAFKPVYHSYFVQYFDFFHHHMNVFTFLVLSAIFITPLDSDHAECNTLANTLALIVDRLSRSSHLPSYWQMFLNASDNNVYRITCDR